MRRLALAAYLLVVAVGFVVLGHRQQATDERIVKVERSIATRCAQGDDGACDRLRDRLLETANKRERREFNQILDAVINEGGGPPRGGNPPSGIDEPSPPGGGSPPASNPPAPGGPSPVPQPPPPPSQGPVGQAVDDAQGLVDWVQDTLCSQAPATC